MRELSDERKRLGESLPTRKEKLAADMNDLWMPWAKFEYMADHGLVRNEDFPIESNSTDIV